MAETGNKSTKIMFLRNQQEQAKLMAKAVAIDEKNTAIASLEIRIKYESDASEKQKLIDELIALSKAPLTVELDLPEIPCSPSTTMSNSVSGTPSVPTTSASATPASLQITDASTTPVEPAAPQCLATSDSMSGE